MKRTARSNPSRGGKNTTKNILDHLFGSADILNLFSKMMVVHMYEDLQENMVKALQVSIGAATDQETQPINEDYATRFACALYYIAISMPYAIAIRLGGPINVAWNLMHDDPERCSPAVMLKFFQEGFGAISPTMATAVTETVIVKTAKLLLWDWMTNGEPNEENYGTDSHFYFHEVISLESSPNAEAVREEGYQHVMNMSPEELADYDPELVQMVREWKPEARPTDD